MDFIVLLWVLIFVLVHDILFNDKEAVWDFYRF